MINILIDGREITAQSGGTVLKTAKEHGILIPSLCGDERVAARGSCGLCVVEIEGYDGLARACGTEAVDRMVIATRSARIDTARRTILELMLSVHTGECRPVCQLNCPLNAYASVREIKRRKG
jgi:formate dehydrogenase major subunit